MIYDIILIVNKYGKKEVLFLAIRLIIFDNFGVICHEAAPFWFPKYFSEEDSVRIKNDIVTKGDWGEISASEMYNDISKMINYAESPEQIENSWLELARKNPDMIALIRETKKKYKTALLSNAVEGLLERIYTPKEFEELFDYTAISYIEHIAKPDERFFNLLLDRAGIRPEEAFFIDDNSANIRAAEALGIKGVVFTDCETLKKVLSSLE